jgi:hypothetical protein
MRRRSFIKYTSVSAAGKWILPQCAIRLVGIYGTGDIQRTHFFQDWSELESPMPSILDPLNTASGTETRMDQPLSF